MRVILLLLAFAFPLIGSAQETTRVTVVHQKTFAVVSVLSDAGALAKFESLWKAKVPANPGREPNWVYKIDVETAQSSDRWFYDPDGWTQKRSRTETVIYRFPAPKEFNAILGIDLKD